MLDTPDSDRIQSSFDDQHERVYHASFTLAEFLGRTPESVRDLGWKLVEQLKADLPDSRPWSAYRVLDGNITITSRRQLDVEANLAQLTVLANLEAAGITL